MSMLSQLVDRFCIRRLQRKYLLRPISERGPDDIFVVGYPKSGNRMNLIETHRVSDLRDNLGWSRINGDD